MLVVWCSQKVKQSVPLDLAVRSEAVTEQDGAAEDESSLHIPVSQPSRFSTGSSCVTALLTGSLQPHICCCSPAPFHHSPLPAL